jgi:hypothetical protein
MIPLFPIQENSKMRNYKLLILVGTSIASLLSSLLAAVAVPNLTYNGVSTYKDAKDNIYIITTYNEELTYSGVEITKASYSDACGFTSIKLSNSNVPFPSSIAFNGISNSVGSIPVATEKNPYKCVNGAAQWNGTPRTSIFQTSVTNENGSITVKNIYFPLALTGGASKQGLISYTANVIKKLTPNACGFIVTPGYANSLKKTSGSVKISGQASSLNIANLPVNPNPPDCVGGKTLMATTAGATFNGASLYRTTKSIFYVGLTPNSLNAVELNGLASKDINYYKGYEYQAGYPLSACGLFYIDFKKVRVPNLKIGDTNYPVATAPAKNLPIDCTAATFASLTPNTLYLNDDLFNGSASRFIYRLSDITKKKLTIEYPTIISKNLAVNTCGFTEIKSLNASSGFNATDKVKINGTEYTVSSLPLSPTAPTCKNGVTYLVTP